MTPDEQRRIIKKAKEEADRETNAFGFILLVISLAMLLLVCIAKVVQAQTPQVNQEAHVISWQCNKLHDMWKRGNVSAEMQIQKLRERYDRKYGFNVVWNKAFFPGGRCYTKEQVARRLAGRQK